MGERHRQEMADLDQGLDKVLRSHAVTDLETPVGELTFAELLEVVRQSCRTPEAIAESWHDMLSEPVAFDLACSCGFVRARVPADEIRGYLDAAPFVRAASPGGLGRGALSHHEAKVADLR